MARPSIYSDELADSILGKLIDGASLRQICDLIEMPDRRTVLRWLENDEGFATKYARARASQADLMDDKINELAESCTPTSAPADRVKLAAMQWRAAKLLPKKYGERLQHANDPDNPLTAPPADPREVAKSVLAILSGAVTDKPEGS